MLDQRGGEVQPLSKACLCYLFAPYRMSKNTDLISVTEKLHVYLCQQIFPFLNLYIWNGHRWNYWRST